MNEGNSRENIKEGLSVGIVLKQDQRSGKITQGIVKRILTNASYHPHGIKVELKNGQVGRVKEIHSNVARQELFIGHWLRSLIDLMRIVFRNTKDSYDSRSLVEIEHGWHGFDGYPRIFYHPCQSVLSVESVFHPIFFS
ncbi:MAG: YwbE family protein [Candidatus Methanoperedens sp.]|nr:YwbE family protein [Candidatus Methanoperedens sp.]MCZ7369281.1 YwbE family protein [Candidatus Methanoperedens sp.]